MEAGSDGVEVGSGLPTTARHRAGVASCLHVTAAASMGPHRMLEHLRRRWLSVLHLHSNGAAAEVMGKSGSRRGGLAPLLGDRWRKKPLSGKGFGGVEAGVVWRRGEIRRSWDACSDLFRRFICSSGLGVGRRAELTGIDKIFGCRDIECSLLTHFGKLATNYPSECLVVWTYWLTHHFGGLWRNNDVFPACVRLSVQAAARSSSSVAASLRTSGANGIVVRLMMSWCRTVSISQVQGRYVSVRTNWLNGDFIKVAKDDHATSSRTIEKFQLAMSNLKAK
ncbi:unnamed protein product [Miscanthus lutarioriparius]|uniref:Uncharacterized protein n=1 Tax=Miscanthus lutarioriparius TaxID=422564 RepID=A0A811MVG1_9POAL|nr:unnamed protein product [Miscanthus lutarioriparius]